jgi:hypothetical protein
MDLEAPTIAFFFCSSTPFYYGVYGTFKSLLIPSWAQNYLNLLEVYSPPLSDLNTLIFLPVWFSTRDLNSWNHWKTCPLVFMKKIQDFREKSSMKEREVIKERDIIQEPSQICRRHRTTHIGMNQIKDTSFSTITAWKRSLGVLPKSTPLAHLLVLCNELLDY